jgi:hypothetical protein
MREAVRNIGASVRGRLQNISRERNQTFQLVLTHYVLERLLYRLSQTKYRDRFVLKGAMLITKWFADPLRPTQDLDLLGFGDAAGRPDACVRPRPCQNSAMEFVCGRCGVSARLLRRGDSRFGGVSYAARGSRACPRWIR